MWKNKKKERFAFETGVSEPYLREGGGERIISLKSFSTHTKLIQESPLTGSRKEKQGSRHALPCFWSFFLGVWGHGGGFSFGV